MGRYRIAEDKNNLNLAPWLDAIGIEYIDDHSSIAPALVAWLPSGNGQKHLAETIVVSLNAIQMRLKIEAEAKRCHENWVLAEADAIRARLIANP